MDGPHSKVPSLAAWLGDGGRGEGFEAILRFVEDISSGDAYPDAPPEAKAFVRIWTTMCIGAVEACRKEDDIGTSMSEILVFVARAAGAAAAVAVMSPMPDDVPQKMVRRLLREELLRGAYWFLENGLQKGGRQNGA